MGLPHMRDADTTVICGTMKSQIVKYIRIHCLGSLHSQHPQNLFQLIRLGLGLTLDGQMDVGVSHILGIVIVLLHNKGQMTDNDVFNFSEI